MKQFDTIEGQNVPVLTDKKHIGNSKLSDSGKAIKIHIFKPEIFLVIPLTEIADKSDIGKVFHYSNNVSEIVGEIYKPKSGGKFFTIHVDESTYFLQANYVSLLMKGSPLLLPVFEE